MSSVDVIVPCYRYGHFLKECVASVLSQEAVSTRVLIIDDASPDNSAEIAADLATADPRITFLRHAQNRGHIATYNEGIEWVSSDYMLLLSADDYLLPGALHRAAQIMDADPNVAFTFGNALERSPSGAEKPIQVVPGYADKRIISGIRFIQLSGPGNIVPAPTAIVRTQIQQRVGGYRSELTHSGDMEMWLRLAAHGSVGMLKSYQAVYRRHSANMSLAYKWEADLLQRKAALDSFFQTCGHMLPNSDKVQRKVYWLLVCRAVGLASTAFNTGEMQASEDLCDLALRMCPSVRWSSAWLKFACKRRMGYRTWNAVEPNIRAAGQMLSSLKLKPR